MRPGSSCATPVPARCSTSAGAREPSRRHYGGCWRRAIGAAASRAAGIRHAQGHHIHHWANGGPTRLDNLALLRRRHHQAVHEDGYTVERDADGTLHFRTAQGWLIPAVPPSPPVPPDPMQTLVRANQARGLVIDAQTALPTWTGERLDLGWAISVLHLANPGGTAAQVGHRQPA